MLTIEDVLQALQRGRKSFDALQAAYERLPDTRCNCGTPGVCCRFMPEMTLLEALQWIDAAARMPAGKREALLRRFVSFYLATPLRQEGCPFLKEGGCSIYPRRPFACRAYGLWSAAAGQARTRQHRGGKKKLIRSWRRLGIRVPEDAVPLEPDYCTQVESVRQPPPSDRYLMEVLERVYALDTPLARWRDRFEQQVHSDFSYLVAALSMGARKAVLAKMAVIQELAEKGTGRRLEKHLSRLDAGALGERFEDA